jgi:hypothetical protein
MISKYVRQILQLALLLIAVHSLPASASFAVGPTVTVGVTFGPGATATVIDTTNTQAIISPYNVLGQAVWTEGFFNSAFAAGVDIYFGVVTPGGTTVYTWAPNSSGTVTLNKGYTPMARAYSVTAPSTFTTQSFNGGKGITYTFSGSEPKGLYTVVFFMVITGDDPTDITKWNNITTQALFVK